MARHTRQTKDSTGLKIGKLHIDYKTSYKYIAQPVYMCTCDCGNKVLMPITMIRSYESCGCVKKNKGSYLVVDSKSIVREPIYIEKNHVVSRAKVGEL